MDSPFEPGLIAEIIGAPNDDFPRLIYADWLEDQNDPRAEFIRLQLARAKMPRADRRWPEFYQRAKKLFVAHGDDWLKPFQAYASHCQFDRGFVREVTLRPHLGSAHLRYLFQLSPIEILRGQITPDVVQWLIESNTLPRITELDFDTSDNVKQSLALLHTATASRHLRRLKLQYRKVVADDLPLLTRTRHLGGLEELLLDENPIGDRGIEELTRAPYWKNLRRLDLNRTQCGFRGVNALLNTSQLPYLREVHIAHNGITVPDRRRLRQRFAHLFV